MRGFAESVKIVYYCSIFIHEKEVTILNCPTLTAIPLWERSIEVEFFDHEG